MNDVYAYDVVIRVLADALILAIVLLGAFALLRYVPPGKRWQAYARVAMAGLTALLLAKLVGTIWQPTDVRPFIEQGIEPGAAYLSNAGFPSDHVLLAAAITFAVWCETKRKMMSAMLLVMTLLMGLGRILAFVHTPLDVAGALLFAAVGAVWYFTGEKTFGDHMTRSKKKHD